MATLGKLFRYDTVALIRVLVPLNIAMAALGVFACICGFAGFSIDTASTTSSHHSDIVEMLVVLAGVSVVLCAFALFSFPFATFAMVVNRFCKTCSPTKDAFRSPCP